MVSKDTVKAVMSQWRPVPDPDGGQSAYIRSSKAFQDADRLTAHQNCMSQKLENTSGDIQDAFSNASEECAKENTNEYADDLPDDFDQKYSASDGS